MNLCSTALDKTKTTVKYAPSHMQAQTVLRQLQRYLGPLFPPLPPSSLWPSIYLPPMCRPTHPSRLRVLMRNLPSPKSCKIIGLNMDLSGSCTFVILVKLTISKHSELYLQEPGRTTGCHGRCTRLQVCEKTTNPSASSSLAYYAKPQRNVNR